MTVGSAATVWLRGPPPSCMSTIAPAVRRRGRCARSGRAPAERVLTVDGPHDHEHAQAPRDRERAPVVGPVGRAEEADGRHPAPAQAARLPPHLGELAPKRETRQRRVVQRVVPYRMAVPGLGGQRARPAVERVADGKERGPHMRAAQGPQDRARVAGRARRRTSGRSHARGGCRGAGPSGGAARGRPPARPSAPGVGAGRPRPGPCPRAADRPPRAVPLAGRPARRRDPGRRSRRRRGAQGAGARGRRSVDDPSHRKLAH